MNAARLHLLFFVTERCELLSRPENGAAMAMHADLNIDLAIFILYISSILLYFSHVFVVL